MEPYWILTRTFQERGGQGLGNQRMHYPTEGEAVAAAKSQIRAEPSKAPIYIFKLAGVVQVTTPPIEWLPTRAEGG